MKEEEMIDDGPRLVHRKAKHEANVAYEGERLHSMAPCPTIGRNNE